MEMPHNHTIMLNCHGMVLRHALIDFNFIKFYDKRFLQLPKLNNIVDCLLADNTCLDHFVITVAPHHEVNVTNNMTLCGCNLWSRFFSYVS